MSTAHTELLINIILNPVSFLHEETWRKGLTEKFHKKGICEQQSQNRTLLLKAQHLHQGSDFPMAGITLFSSKIQNLKFEPWANTQAFNIHLKWLCLSKKHQLPHTTDPNAFSPAWGICISLTMSFHAFK